MKLLPVTTVGSYAWPGWYYLVVAAAARGELGAEDLKEALDDAVEIALQDQIKAGVDILTDGEMRRVDFIVGFPKLLDGIEELPRERKLGPEGHDQRPRYRIKSEILAPEGLGIFSELKYLSQRTEAPVKVTVPGPHTLAGRLVPDGRIYKSREDIAWALSEIVRAELHVLQDLDPDWVQIDEPSIACYKDNLEGFVEIFNATVEGVKPRLAIHLCFGNFRARPIGLRTYAPLFPKLFELNAQQFVLEFANREMAEADLWRRFPNDRELAAGVVDVKNHFVEPVETLTERIRLMLKSVKPEKLSLVPDCGFSQTPRHLAFAKLQNLVQAAQMVRKEI